MGKKSRDKGKRGEREIVHLLRAHGIEAHRSAQVDGTLSSDVVLDDIDGFHLEVKRYARIGAFRFWDQATEDAAGACPVLFMREDGAPWLACVDAQFFCSLLRQYLASLGETGGTPS